MTESRNVNNEQAARVTLSEVMKLIHGDFQLHSLQMEDSEPSLDGKVLAQLLNSNFKRLDPNGDGISRDELMDAVNNRDQFSADEYAMLLLVSKYFRTISNMSDDQDGPETVISPTDLEVLSQFLTHSPMTIEDLHKWEEHYASLDLGLPDLTQGGSN